MIGGIGVWLRNKSFYYKPQPNNLFCTFQIVKSLIIHILLVFWFSLSSLNIGQLRKKVQNFLISKHYIWWSHLSFFQFLHWIFFPKFPNSQLKCEKGASSNKIPQVWDPGMKKDSAISQHIPKRCIVVRQQFCESEKNKRCGDGAELNL